MWGCVIVFGCHLNNQTTSMLTKFAGFFLLIKMQGYLLTYWPPSSSSVALVLSCEHARSLRARIVVSSLGTTHCVQREGECIGQ